MWDLIVSVPDHCLSFYLLCRSKHHFHAGFDANLEIIRFIIPIEENNQGKDHQGEPQRSQPFSGTMRKSSKA